ncbi:type II secretion system protein [Ornithinibacillus gellani]|uniref:type II secretion system protein n=1 Tax=Ornithinibacillus gellani TaxID=2293253 RepID=UPI0016819432
MRKANGFTLIEVLFATGIICILATTFIPILSLVAQERVVLSDRRFIVNQLQDDLQIYMWENDTYPSIYEKNVRQRVVNYIFQMEHALVKGCANWINVKQREEVFCLYAALPE